MDCKILKETIFETVGFKYDDEIVFYENDRIKIEYDGKCAKIGASSKNEFARACFLFALNITEGKTEFIVEEEKHFEKLGFFLDCSRNGVMRVSALKRYINYISALGFDFLMLYTEDTFEIDNRPRFGYLRGRYSKKEIAEVVEYGQEMGIEIIPCIQTLGHMTQYLKWSNSEGPDYTGEEILNIRDTEDVLMCGEEETYKFIDDAVRTCREMYKTDKIHIGMDEADSIGRGQYLDKNGYENKFDIIKKHLDTVTGICKKYNLHPMIWSDMFFRLGSGGYYRYDFDFPEGLKEQIPDVELVYWDYYHNKDEMYDNMFKKHYELSENVAFAGGIGTWFGFLPAHNYSYMNSLTALKSCIKHNVKTVIATTWGDDGNETNAFFARPLISVYSEFCYKGDKCTEDDIKRVSEFLTKMKFDDARMMGNFSFIKPNPYLDEWIQNNGGGAELLMGKRLFYADILYDLSVRYDSCDEIIQIYENCAKRMKELCEKNDVNKADYNYAYLLYKIGSMKAELVKNLRKKYKKDDKEYLSKVAYKYLPQLKKWYEEFTVCHKEQWMTDYKAFGYEVLSFRFGGVIARVDYSAEVIDKYLKGEISVIEELEPEILINEETYSATVPFLVSPSGTI